MTTQMNGDAKEPSPYSARPINEGGEKVVLGGAFTTYIPTPKNKDQQRSTPKTRYYNYLKLLSVRLPDVYRRANTSFEYLPSFNPRRVLTHPSEGVSNQNFDNSNSDYIVYVNDIIGTAANHRYHVLDLLGQGTFGQVVKCQNCDTDDMVALKILKNKPAYLNQGLVETRILEMLNNHVDPDNKYHTVRLLDYFMFRRHLCLVFELLSVNLYELIKQNHFRGLSTNLIRVFMIQILDALTVLSQSNIIHCDLKPENVLLYNLNSPTIKLIDFGSACFENQTVYSYIQSRHYRCPEVLIGSSYSAAIDVWSLGCIAAELFLGLPLFPGTSEFNQLCRIVEMQGQPSDEMLDKAKQTPKFFNKNSNPPPGKSPYTLKTEEEFERATGTATPPSKRYFNYTQLDDIIQNYAFKKNMSKDEIEKEKLNRRSFCDFVSGLLQVDPKDRWTPVQAKGHPFITGENYTEPYKPDPPPPKPSPRSSPASALAFYPPNLQNFPPIPPPVANGNMNGASLIPNSTPNTGQSKKAGSSNSSSSTGNNQTPMLGLYGKQQDFSQSPADTYSPRGYFAHVMQQQHPATLLGQSPSTHHFQSPHYMSYTHQHYMQNLGASPSMGYGQMWQDYNNPLICTSLLTNNRLISTRLITSNPINKLTNNLTNNPTNPTNNHTNNPTSHTRCSTFQRAHKCPTFLNYNSSPSLTKLFYNLHTCPCHNSYSRHTNPNSFSHHISFNLHTNHNPTTNPSHLRVNPIHHNHNNHSPHTFPPTSLPTLNHHNLNHNTSLRTSIPSVRIMRKRKPRKERRGRNHNRTPGSPRTNRLQSSPRNRPMPQSPDTHHSKPDVYQIKDYGSERARGDRKRRGRNQRHEGVGVEESAIRGIG